MKKRNSLRFTSLMMLVMVFIIPGTKLAAQNIGFGVFADPLICWFSSDTKAISNEGSRPGFNFGMTFNRYFGKNYSFSTGISLANAGGRLTGTDTIQMVFNNYTAKVAPGDPVVYRIQYLNIPLGLKFESNQVGYLNFFTDLGLDAKVVISGKADIPSQNIKKENAGNELNTFNLGYHLMAGVQYSLGGNTAMVFGLAYEHNFLDITKEIGDQPKDKIMHNFLRIRIGVNF